MATHTSTENTRVNEAEKIKQEIAGATDINKLLTKNKFIEKLKKLPETEQFKIFQQYKSQFDEVSKDPGSAIAKLTANFTKNLPNLGGAEKTLNDGIQQGQHFLENFGNSLK